MTEPVGRRRCCPIPSRAAPDHRTARRSPRDIRTRIAVHDGHSGRSSARRADDHRVRTRPRSLRRHPDPPYGCHRLAGCSPLRRAEILAQGRSRHTMRGGRADRVGDWHPCVRGECLPVGALQTASGAVETLTISINAVLLALESQGWIHLDPSTPRRGERRSQRSTPLHLPCPSPSDSTTCRLTRVDSTVKRPCGAAHVARGDPLLSSVRCERSGKTDGLSR
jgi:hypothetical protein